MGKRRRISFFKIHESESRDGHTKFVKVHVNRRKNGHNNFSVVEVLRSGIEPQVWECHHNDCQTVYYSSIYQGGRFPDDSTIVLCPFQDPPLIRVQAKDIPDYLHAIIDDTAITLAEFEAWLDIEFDDANPEDTLIGVWLREEQTNFVLEPPEHTIREIFLDHGLYGYIQNIFGDVPDEIISKVVHFPKKIIKEHDESFYTCIVYKNSAGNIVKISSAREERLRALSVLNEVVVHHKLCQAESFKNRCPALKSVSDVTTSEGTVKSVVATMSFIGKTLGQRAREEDQQLQQDLEAYELEKKLDRLFNSMRETKLTHNNLHINNIYENVDGEYGLIDFENSQIFDDPTMDVDLSYDLMLLLEGSSQFKNDELKRLFIKNLENVAEQTEIKRHATTPEIYFRDSVYPSITAKYAEIIDQIKSDYAEVKKSFH